METEESDRLPEAVLAGLRAGEASALEDCYRRFGSRVYRICRGMLRQPTDAEDATQEVFLKVLVRAHQFEERARFSTWLHRLTVNLCLNRIEKERLRVGPSIELGEGAGGELVDQALSPLEAAVRGEAGSRALTLLAQLPPDSRAVLVLRELEELTYAEIAQVLSVPVGTVMSRLARAREKVTALVSLPHKKNPTCRSAS